MVTMLYIFQFKIGSQPGNGRPKKERGFYATGGRKANFFMHFDSAGYRPGNPGGICPLNALSMRCSLPPFMLFITRCISRNCFIRRFTS